LASQDDLAPQVFDDLIAALGHGWNGHLSQRPAERGTRAGWRSTGQLTTLVDIFRYPDPAPATKVNDQGPLISETKRGMLAVTYTRGDGLMVHALAAHLKSKLLTLPGRGPQRPRFDTEDEGERARFGLYALDQRAA